MPTDLLTRLQKNARARERLLAERDELILQAKTAAVPATHIAAAVGLSPMQVHRILAVAKAQTG